MNSEILVFENNNSIVEKSMMIIPILMTKLYKMTFTLLALPYYNQNKYLSLQVNIIIIIVIRLSVYVNMNR